jgi:arsenate reductase (thioredoxin)
MTDEKTVLFVCLHGAGMSRLAAAYFAQLAPAGWCGISAGLDPAETLSHTAAGLLAGTAAVAFLDLAPPRPIGAVPEPDRLIALRNPSIRYELQGADTWDRATTRSMRKRSFA